MSMTQLVFGTALGFFVAQGVLYSVQHLVGWLRRSDARKRILEPTPTLASTLIGGFTKYAALAGLSAALITVGVCAVGDHFAAKSARPAVTAHGLESSTPVAVSNPRGSP